MADVDIPDLIKFHEDHGRWATVTAVQPPGRYGLLDCEESVVKGFIEKPKGDGGLINGGFFVLIPEVLKLITGDSTSFENEALPMLVSLDQMRAYRHGGFWQPMASRIQMIQGSSIAPEIVEQVRHVANGYKRILVCLDSNHTHAHVLAELEAYAPLTSVGSYCCVVFDTIVEDMPGDMFPDRPWGRATTRKPPCGNTSKHIQSLRLIKVSRTSF